MHMFIRFSKILILCCVFLGILLPLGAFAQNTAIRQQTNLIPRYYDFPGARFDLVQPGAINPMPAVAHSYINTNNALHRSIFGLAGIWYPSSVEYQTGVLTPEGSSYNLILNPEFKQHALRDTPYVALRWDRGGFNTNLFSLQFERLVTDSVLFALYANSEVLDSSGNWRYQPVTHQPYLSVFKRDSSLVPFTGRNLRSNTSHFIPAIRYYKPHFSVELFAGLYKNSSDDVSQYWPGQDSVLLEEKTFKDKPYEPNIQSTTLGFSLQAFHHNLYQLQLGYSKEARNSKFGNVPDYFRDIDDSILAFALSPTDITLADSTQDSIQFLKDSILEHQSLPNEYSIKESNHTAQVHLYSQSKPWLPSIHFWSEFLFMPTLQTLQEQKTNEPWQQNRQLGYIQWQNKGYLLPDWFVHYRLQSGVSLNNSVQNTKEHHAIGAAYLQVQHKWGQLQAQLDRQYQYADVHQSHVFHTGRLQFPNHQLGTAQKTTAEAGGTLHLGRFKPFLYKSFEWTRSPVVPAWALLAKNTVHSDTAAFYYTNGDSAEIHAWRAGMSFPLGNWNFTLQKYWHTQEHIWQNGTTLSAIPHLSSTYYKGSIIWGNRFVEKRMGVQVEWNWEWHGARQDIARVWSENQAQVQDLPHFLVLDFAASMQITSFTLTSRIQNFNHSVYYPGVGYTPAGVHFRYAIQWHFGD
jgi:hypothetical protein